MNPTPTSAGASSMASSALGKTGSAAERPEGTTKASETSSLMAAPSAMPRKIHALPEPSDAVARNTSAHAVPSG